MTRNTAGAAGRRAGEAGLRTRSVVHPAPTAITLLERRGCFCGTTAGSRFKYRFAGREKRISMGIYPEISLRLARQRRDEARKLLARDIDPSAYRQARKQSRRQGARNSFEAVAIE